jgi:hypothetical protein
MQPSAMRKYLSLVVLNCLCSFSFAAEHFFITALNGVNGGNDPENPLDLRTIIETDSDPIQKLGAFIKFLNHYEILLTTAFEGKNFSKDIDGQIQGHVAAINGHIMGMRAELETHIIPHIEQSLRIMEDFQSSEEDIFDGGESVQYAEDLQNSEEDIFDGGESAQFVEHLQMFLEDLRSFGFKEMLNELIQKSGRMLQFLKGHQSDLERETYKPVKAGLNLAMNVTEEVKVIFSREFWFRLFGCES